MTRLLIAMLVAVSGTAFGLGPGAAAGAETTPTQTGGRDAAHLHYSQGVGLLSAGDLLGARAELREALRLQPDLVQARFSLGTALYLSGDVDSAIDAYRVDGHARVGRRASLSQNGGESAAGLGDSTL